jgi:hypothetical protein
MFDSMMNVGWALLPDLSCADDGQECLEVGWATWRPLRGHTNGGVGDGRRPAPSAAAQPVTRHVSVLNSMRTTPG